VKPYCAAAGTRVVGDGEDASKRKKGKKGSARNKEAGGSDDRAVAPTHLFMEKGLKWETY